jgi:hypothetical protein
MFSPAQGAVSVPDMYVVVTKPGDHMASDSGQFGNPFNGIDLGHDPAQDCRLVARSSTYL